MGFQPQKPSSGISPVVLVEVLVVLLVIGVAGFAIYVANHQSVDQTLMDAIATRVILPTRTLLPTRTFAARIPFVPSATAQLATRAPTSDLSDLTTPTDLPYLAGFFNFPADVDPLTGLKVDDISRLERRPVMVKVSNFPRTGRPHAGLSFADVVFEYYIGYGLNRFAAIYLGQDASQVGPVRSGRLVDAQLGELYQSIFVYGDADPTIDDVIVGELGARALAEKYMPTPPRYRIGGGITEINLFFNTAEVTDYVNKYVKVSDGRRDLRGMVFGDLVNSQTKAATEIGVQYGKITRGEWRYDDGKGKYLAWQEEPKGDNDLNMIPMVDRLTKEQLAFSNIIILFATYKEYAPTKHDIKLYDNPEGKRAVFFRDGVMTEGKWKTPGNGHPIQFQTNWNTPYILKPGNTWIVLAGDSSLFDEKDKGDWEMRFDLP